MPEHTKVYDYKPDIVEQQIVTALRRRNRESTIADIISTTGLPKYQVQTMMNEVVRDYAGHLRVTESGEILYYFPEGMRNRRKGFVPGLKRFMSRAMRVAARVLTFLFKIWIMGTLIGYFLIFIGLLLLAMLASIAGSANSRDSDRGGGRDRIGGFGSFYLTARVIQLFVTLWLYSGTPSRSGGGFFERRQKAKGRPLHQSIFAFVFGDETPLKEWPQREKQEFIRLIQSQKGVVSLEEVMHLTGRSRSSAEQVLSEYLVEFEGEPDVTESGVLIYRFPELMRTNELALAGTHFQREFKPLIPFNKNKGNANKWIGFFNGFNLVFGSYFLVYSYLINTLSPQRVLDRFYAFVISLVGQISANPAYLVAIVLGIIPVVFSVVFFLVPIIRRAVEKNRNEEIKQDNLRKRTVANVLADPAVVDPEEIVPQLPEEKPRNWPEFITSAIRDLSGDRPIDVEEKRAEQDGKPAAYLYHIPELKRDLLELEKYRSTVQIDQYSVGKTIFDSGADVGPAPSSN